LHSTTTYTTSAGTLRAGFSQHKRRLGSALTARNTACQNRELVLRVLTHNLMLLAKAA
jgi:transposase